MEEDPGGQPADRSAVDRLLGPSDDWTRSAFVVGVLLTLAPPAGAAFEPHAPIVLPELMRIVFALLVATGVLVLAGLLHVRGLLTARRYLVATAGYLAWVLLWAAASSHLVEKLRSTALGLSTVNM